MNDNPPGEPTGARDPIRDMESQSMLTALQENETREEWILTEMDDLFRKIDGLIPQLPPLISDDITEIEKKAQTDIKALLLYRFSDLLTGRYNADVAGGKGPVERPTIASFLAFQESIGTLVERGVITAKESKDFNDRSRERRGRLYLYSKRHAEIFETHGGQLWRT